ncbi:hypothetical protein ACJ73_08651 [Blastomyces percursus]|uniref:Uncharacterized protein n=1 Tax=Blastomyces percursus TaxID=1658174 RepID=A0A1J9PTT9_9EURO|nr:hypothetical protein ACJ73_08651 [Blastomyces percursus]
MTPQSNENTNADFERRPKERLGTPATFDASDLTLYPSWKLDMMAKLEVDGNAIAPPVDASVRSPTSYAREYLQAFGRLVPGYRYSAKIVGLVAGRTTKEYTAHDLFA